ncbi:MAG: hypothetical protein VKJ02_14995 [Snowella sp.]|nr:hypothetical protein [Snowella sp.]
MILAFGALTAECLTLKKDLTLEEAWRLAIADMIKLSYFSR